MSDISTDITTWSSTAASNPPSGSTNIGAGLDDNLRAVQAAVKAWYDADKIPAGTLMLFQQTAAPTGWTKQVTHNDKALRVVSGTASSGGATAFTSVFGASIATGGHSITQAELPNCSFTVTDPGHTHGTATGGYTGSVSSGVQTGNTPGNNTGTITSATTGITVASGGSGTAHTHSMSMDVQYVDLIIAAKN